MTVRGSRLTLIVLAVLALLLQNGSVPHQHLASQAGLFNHDHDLSMLATVAGGLVPDSSDPGPALVPLALVAIPAVAVPALAPRRHANPRAPPR